MLINEIPYYIARSLILTIVIEVSIAFLIGIRKRRDLLNVFLVNMLTNPVVSIIPITLNVYVSLYARNISLIILEIIVLFLEGFIYKFVLEYKKINWFLISLILNACSFGIGEVLNYLI